MTKTKVEDNGVRIRYKCPDKQETADLRYRREKGENRISSLMHR